MSRPWKRWGNALAAFLLAGGLYLSGALDPVERALTNTRFSLAERPASGSLVVVAIDPYSLIELDTWPWPRSYHAAVINQLLDAGASNIALDIDVSSYSTPSADNYLADALQRAHGEIILPVFRQKADGAVPGSDVIYTAPVPIFRRQARIASVNTMPEGDGLIRRHSLFDFWQDGVVRTMPAALAGSRGAIHDIFHIDYGIQADSIPRISYVDLLNGRFDPADIKGRSVIIGATAVELGDQFAVPRYQALPGPVVQAMAYESLVQDRTLLRGSPWLILLVALAVSVVLARRMRLWSWRRGLAAILAVASVSYALSVLVQIWTPMMLEISPWITAALFLYGGALARRIDRQELLLVLRGNRLRRSNALMRSVVESSSEAILTASEEMIVETANPAASKIFGAGNATLTGRPLERLLPFLDAAVGLRPFLEKDEALVEIEGRRLDGTDFPLELSVDSMTTDGTVHYVLVARDITDRMAHQRMLEYLALHDTLTGLPNRTLLVDRIEHAIALAQRENRPVALMLLDLDRFKEVNDTLGHTVGDALLGEVGQMIGAPLSASDTVARLGGDEFAVLLPAVTSLAQARDAAQRILAAIDRPFPVDDLTLEVGASIGIAMYPDHGKDAHDLMRSADVAMYIAKRDRCGIAVYDESRDNNSVRNLSMTGELRRAMDEDELELHYQPQIDIATGALAGAEALVRWNHPRYGMVPPGEFVSLAEQSGLIGPLTRWVVGKAMKQLGDWQALGYAVCLSANLSPRNLHEEDLAETVARMMERRNIRPGSLTLEITENAIMTDPERALTALRELRESGVRLAIDDFGTGHSSLSYLKTLPVDELKIDKTFVTHILEDDSDAVILRATVGLAHDLGLKIVAEGVESEPQLQVLRVMKCDLAQGYHVAMPMPAGEFQDWMAERLTAAPEGSATIHPLSAASRRRANRS